jgi:hypothetical protein
MGRRTPQEKKRLSYLKDRRNTYGENSKSSRKNIPRNRKIKHRAERHQVRQALDQARGVPDESRADEAEQRYKGRRPSHDRWRKYADSQLAYVVISGLRMRVERGNADPEQAEARIRRIKKRLP